MTIVVNLFDIIGAAVSGILLLVFAVYFIVIWSREARLKKRYMENGGEKGKQRGDPNAMRNLRQ